jgi:hypothetical protein
MIGTGYFGLMKVPKELIENIKLSGIEEIIIKKPEMPASNTTNFIKIKI